MLKFGLAALASLLAISAGAARASTTVGTTDTNNCIPFNCNFSGSSSGEAADYEQIYSETAFSGITTFSEVTFFKGFGIVLSGNYDIIFGTTKQPLGSGYPLTLTDSQTFFDGSLPPGPGSGAYGIKGNAITYNPADGNLVMEVIVTNQADLIGVGDFDADDTGSVMSRTYDVGGFAPSGDGLGLVTEFATPEPASWILMLTGFAGLGAALRLRRSGRRASSAPA